MAINFQYNKTFLQQLNKALRVRENALPTLIAKESALRVEVTKAKENVAAIELDMTENMRTIEGTLRLWREFPEDMVSVSDVKINIRKIAGVKTPELGAVKFNIRPYSIFAAPAWLPLGIEILQKLAEMQIRLELAQRKTQILEFARKKTTQKVNLYEKVQIPEYKEAIRRIKRFLEDEENLAKSSQKILKARIAAVEASR